VIDDILLKCYAYVNKNACVYIIMAFFLFLRDGSIMDNNEKKSNGKLPIVFVLILCGICLTAGFFLLFNKLKKPEGGFETAELTVKNFIEAFNNTDEEMMRKSFLPDYEKADEYVKTNMKKAEEMHSSLRLYAEKMLVNDGTLSDNEIAFIKSEFKDEIKDIAKLTVKIPFDQSYKGEVISGYDCYEATCIDIKNRWFLYSLVNTNVDIDHGYIPGATEQDAVPETATPDDAPVDPSVPELTIDGESYTLPFKYELIKDKFTFDLAEYGYEDGYIMQPKESVSTTVKLRNASYDESFIFLAGFKNQSDEDADIKDCDIDSVSVNIFDCTTTSYPDMRIPGGIGWGSSLDSVTAVFGTPSSEPEYNEETGCYKYKYNFNNSVVYVLYISNLNGLRGFEMDIY